MNNTKHTSNSGIGVLGCLGIAFVILKLTGYITWSWWWVTLPFWGGFVAVFLVLVVLLIIHITSSTKNQP